MGHGMTKNEIIRAFMSGRNCAQCVVGQYADYLCFDREETDRMAACFGGGMGMGQTCGAVTGALITIGMATEDNGEAAVLSRKFVDRFRELHGSCLCQELLGLEVFDPDKVRQMALSGQIADRCSDLVGSSFSILDELLDGD